MSLERLGRIGDNSSEPSHAPPSLERSGRMEDATSEAPHVPLSLGRQGDRHLNVRGGKGTISWSPHTLPCLSNARGGGGKIRRPPGAIPHLLIVVASCRRRSLLLDVVVFFVARHVASRAWSRRFQATNLPATHLIANSGDDTACRSIFLMRSRRQNRRWEKTARLIVATRAAGGGALKMRADGNGDRRQSLVRLFFLSFFALRVLSFPPD